MQLTKLEFTSAKRTSRRLGSIFSARRSKVLSVYNNKCSETVTIIHKVDEDTIEDNTETEILAKNRPCNSL